MARTGLIIDPGAGYAQLTDTNGTVVLDTRDQIFHILTKVNGAVSRPAYSSSQHVRTANIDLGAVDANCTAVLGFARLDFTRSSDYDIELASGLWYAVGGTIAYKLAGFQSVSGTYDGYPCAVGLATFALSGGRARFQEEITQSYDRTTTQSAYTMTYRLYCGTFT